MKYSLFCIMVGVVIGFAWVTQAESSAPAKMELIEQEYRQKLEAACRPVNDWYANQMIKLYQFYTENNQLAEAAYVKQKLLTVAPDTQFPSLEEKTAVASTPIKTAPSVAVTPIVPASTAVVLRASSEELKELNKVQKILHGDGVQVGVPLVYPAAAAFLTGKVKMKKDLIASWRGGQSSASWRLGAIKPGTYEIWLEYSTSRAEPTSFDVVAGTQVLVCKRGRVDRTGGWHRFKKQAIGRIYIEPEAKTISIIKTERGSWLFNLRELQLKPILD